MPHRGVGLPSEHALHMCIHEMSGQNSDVWASLRQCLHLVVALVCPAKAFIVQGLIICHLV